MSARLLIRRSFSISGQLRGGVPLKPPPPPSVPVHIPSHRSPFYASFRTLCSASSNMVPIRSEADFNAALAKVQGESFPAIFYFTAVWCGPCRFLAPVIGELSEKYSHVTTYKIDIDQEGLEKALGDMKVSAVPTLHFFRDGKKEAEIVGANVTGLKDTMDKLYGL